MVQVYLLSYKNFPGSFGQVTFSILLFNLLPSENLGEFSVSKMRKIEPECGGKKIQHNATKHLSLLSREILPMQNAGINYQENNGGWIRKLQPGSLTCTPYW